MRRMLALVALALVGSALPAGAASDGFPPGQIERIKCHDDEDTAKDLRIPVNGETATGRYALPAEKDPATLIVFGHGYGHDSTSWIEHMRNAARDHGVVSVTMDYRGTYRQGAGTRGWFVKEGADDMIAATKFFQQECPSIEQVIIFGVSMGGNSTGLAVARASREEDAEQDPLFDYWFNIEGAVNVIETYAGASALAGSGNTFANNAKADIEQEMGGKTLAEDPEGYADLAVVSHSDEIAASGVKGVVMVHAIEDGLVPYNQPRELIPLLLKGGIPVEMYTAGRHEGESGTTITGYSGQKVSPFAGHATESSQRHIIMTTAFDRLWELVDEGAAVETYMEYFVDPEAGTFPPR